MDYEALIAELRATAQDTTRSRDVYDRLDDCTDRDLLALYRHLFDRPYPHAYVRLEVIDDIAVAVGMGYIEDPDIDPLD